MVCDVTILHIFCIVSVILFQRVTMNVITNSTSATTNVFLECLLVYLCFASQEIQWMHFLCTSHEDNHIRINSSFSTVVN